MRMRDSRMRFGDVAECSGGSRFFVSLGLATGTDSFRSP